MGTCSTHTLSGAGTTPIGCPEGARTSQYLTDLSQDPVTIQGVFIACSLTYSTHRTGSSCCATVAAVFFPRSHIFTILSAPAVKTAWPSSLQATESIGPSCRVEVSILLLPSGLISQSLASLSQVPPTRKFFGCSVRGENAICEILSFGGLATKKSLFGFEKPPPPDPKAFIPNSTIQVHPPKYQREHPDPAPAP